MPHWGMGESMKSRTMYALCAAVLLVSAAPRVMAQATPSPASEEQAKAALEAKYKALEGDLHPQNGDVTIPGANAMLRLGDAYYFLPAEEAKRVLTEAWGNPPSQVSSVLGMVFPAGKTFHDATWGAVIEYEDTGHVSDKDAAAQDYSSVLSDMQSAEKDANESAKSEGYPGQHLIGWAQAPTYDSGRKTLIWARNIKFDGASENTLNYDVRTLGRTGVLSLNMVDSMSNLNAVRVAATGLGSTVSFNSGFAYNDFNSSTDRMADYGLAGLVAAGAGLLVAKKVGLLAVALIFLKKAIAFIIAGAVALGAWWKRRFRGGGEQEGTFDDRPAEELPPAE
jgi:uncharacterized membrane-anchored protein